MVHPLTVLVLGVYATAMMVALSIENYDHGYDKCMQENTQPTVTGEYGNPDGWETLTGPYVE